MQVQERQQTTERETWAGRPRLALVMRLGAWLVPIALSLVTTIVLARVFPKPSSTVELVLWWVALTACATGVLAAADRFARGLLPLAALFRLSLVFPDQAPSRFKAALRSGTVRQLEDRVRQVKEEGLSDDPIIAAETLIELVAALSKHDHVTRGHAERVRAYAKMIGDEMGLNAEDADRLQWAALLHDVGKLFVPADILNKPGTLTHDEYEIVKTHPAAGASLCEPLRGWLGDWVDAVGEHHEKWDGTGYPRGLSGTDISLAARIVSVADVYDVITSARSYKAPCSPVEAREELTRCAGSHFDPRVVRAFMSVSLGRLRTVMGPLSWLAQVPVLANVGLAPAVGLAGSGMVTAGALMFGGIVDAPHLPPKRPATVEATAASDGRGGSGKLTTSTAPGADDTTVVTIIDPVTGEVIAVEVPASSTTSTIVGERSSTTTTSRPDGTTTTTTTAGGPATTVPPPANRPPTPGNDSFATAAVTTLSVPAPGVLGNDADADGDGLRASLSAGAGHGNVVLSADGAFTYTPSVGFSGADGFTYTADDGHGGSASATVAINVTVVPVTATSWFLGTTGPSATAWDLTTSPGPLSFWEPDWDLDGDPGLGLDNSNNGLAETNPKKFHDWVLTPGAALRLQGTAKLGLWSSLASFDLGDVKTSMWVRDCLADGVTCTTIKSAVNQYVPLWNGGWPGWGYSEVSVGALDYTIPAGHQLRVRLMFSEDVWVALSGARPSRFIVA